MRIAVIGTGYVGLVSGACFSELGFQVICVDKDAGKIERLKRGEVPIYEPGLEDMVKRNHAAERLTFTTDLASAVKDADLISIAVGTPTRKEDGAADLSYVEAAAREVAQALSNYTVICIKSTVPVGTGARVQAIIQATNPALEFDMASNPEFLREGNAIEDFMRPDRVVVGTQSERARAVMERLYRPLAMQSCPVLYTDIPTAELTKYAANTFLAMKITFINEMADLCEAVGANIRDISHGMGLDPRIGARFLMPGPGYGGSCFPKDTLALVKLAQDAGSPVQLIETTVAVNDHRKTRMAEKIIQACGGNVQGKTIALLGLTFKPDTDDVRDSSALVIAETLLAAGATVRAYDPKGMHEAEKQLGQRVSYARNEYQAIDGADAMVLVTEWNVFKSMDLTRVRTLLRSPVIVDLRNIYKRNEMSAQGFTYVSIGRPEVSVAASTTQARKVA